MPKPTEKLPLPTWATVLIVLGLTAVAWFVLAAVSGDPVNSLALVGRLMQVVGIAVCVFWIVVGIVRRLSGGNEAPPKDEEG